MATAKRVAAIAIVFGHWPSSITAGQAWHRLAQGLARDRVEWSQVCWTSMISADGTPLAVKRLRDRSSCIETTLGRSCLWQRLVVAANWSATRRTRRAALTINRVLRQQAGIWRAALTINRVLRQQAGIWRAALTISRVLRQPAARRHLPGAPLRWNYAACTAAAMMESSTEHLAIVALPSRRPARMVAAQYRDQSSSLA